LYYQTFWDVDRIRSCAGETPIDFYYNILQVHLFFTITHTIADTASKVEYWDLPTQVRILSTTPNFVGYRWFIFDTVYFGCCICNSVCNCKKEILIHLWWSVAKVVFFPRQCIYAKQNDFLEENDSLHYSSLCCLYISQDTNVYSKIKCVKIS
jgi:hypothetical protein